MRIHLYAHPLVAPAAPQVFEVDNLAAWLLAHYGPTPTAGMAVQVYEGQPSAETDITGNVPAILHASAPEYTVLQVPAADPFTWIALISFVFSVASILLTPKPQQPSNVNRSQQSPNNALGERSNQMRLGQRVADIYGTVKAIPDVLAPEYTKWINNREYRYGYYCIGVGYYDVPALFDSDTSIADMPGCSAAVYAPFTSPNSGTPQLLVGDPIVDTVLTVTRSQGVDGITLKAPNQVALQPGEAYSFLPGKRIVQARPAPNVNTVINVGDTLNVSMTDYTDSRSITDFGVNPSGLTVTVDATAKTYTANFSGFFDYMEVGDPITFAGFFNSANNGTFAIVAKPSADSIETASTTLVDESSGSVTVSIVRNYTGVYTVATVGNQELTVTLAADWDGPIVNHHMTVTGPVIPHTSAWVTLTDPGRKEVWVNLVAQQGLYKDNGGRSDARVEATLEIEQLDALLAPVGIVETVPIAMQTASAEQQSITVEHVTAWTGPARARMVRTNAHDFEFLGTVVDEVKWADLNSVTPELKANFGNVTTVHTVRRATLGATSGKQDQLNAVVTRKLPIYNGTTNTFSGAFDATGLLASGTIAPTSRMVDIMAAISIDPKIGALDLALEVDMPQIWGAQQQLDAWSAECGQFSYTFDSDQTSYEEMVIMLANAAFCIAYRQNGKIRFAHERAQPTSTALFTHRNKKPRSDTVSRNYTREFDAIKLTYIDEDSNKPETITLPLSGVYSKAKSIEIPGIRSYQQAWYRANREYNKLLLQNDSLETTTTLDGRSLLPNARISVVDNTRFKSYDGEVVGQSGLQLTLSREVVFTPTQPHSLLLMRRDGSLQSIACTPGDAANRVVLASPPTEALTTAVGNDGIRTIFSFAADSARDAMAWLVQEIGLDDKQYCKVSAINYDANYYTSDAIPVPNKSLVIR